MTYGTPGIQSKTDAYVRTKEWAFELMRWCLILFDRHEHYDFSAHRLAALATPTAYALPGP